jgi:hypothetical protein
MAGMVRQKMRTKSPNVTHFSGIDVTGDNSQNSMTAFNRDALPSSVQRCCCFTFIRATLLLFYLHPCNAVVVLPFSEIR